jgi:hypothetical protein
MLRIHAGVLQALRQRLVGGEPRSSTAGITDP